MCLLFETIKVANGKVFHLPYHQKRLGQYSSVELDTYVNTSVHLPATGTYKLRIIYTNDHVYHHTIEPYIPKKIESLKLVIDNHIDYHKKYNDRSLLNHLMVQKNENDDILIVKNGLLTDTSFANIAFFDGHQWMTPETPLLEGTCRARLIDQKIIIPTRITSKDLGLFSKFMLINAMLDFDKQRAIEYSFNGSELHPSTKF